MNFTARFPDAELRFIGTFRGNTVIGAIEHSPRGKKVILRKLRADVFTAHPSTRIAIEPNSNAR